MTLEILLWIAAAGLLPFIGWCLHVTWSLRQNSNDTKELINISKEMQKSLNKTNWENAECIKANTEAINSLTHYIRWLAEKQHGETPPPPVK